MGKIDKIIGVSQEELHDIAQENNAIYSGSCSNIDLRMDQHSSDGYSGTAYYSHTENMMKAEDKLLDVSHGHNIQKSSNAPEAPGNVYVIKGKKFS